MCRPQAPVALFSIAQVLQHVIASIATRVRRRRRSKAGTEQAHPLVQVRVFCLASRSLFRENEIIAPRQHVPRPPLVDGKHHSLSSKNACSFQYARLVPQPGAEDALLLCFYRIVCVGNNRRLLLLIILSFSRRVHKAAARHRPRRRATSWFCTGGSEKNPSGLSHKVTFSWQQSFIYYTHAHTTTFQAITLLLHKLAQVSWFV